MLRAIHINVSEEDLFLLSGVQRASQNCSLQFSKAEKQILTLRGWKLIHVSHGLGKTHHSSLWASLHIECASWRGSGWHRDMRRKGTGTGLRAQQLWGAAQCLSSAASHGVEVPSGWGGGQGTWNMLWDVSIIQWLLQALDYRTTGER